MCCVTGHGVYIYVSMYMCLWVCLCVRGHLPFNRQRTTCKTNDDHQAFVAFEHLSSSLLHPRSQSIPNNFFLAYYNRTTSTSIMRALIFLKLLVLDLFIICNICDFDITYIESRIFYWLPSLLIFDNQISPTPNY